MGVAVTLTPMTLGSSTQIGNTYFGNINGLIVPVEFGTRLMMVFSMTTTATTTGAPLAKTVWGYGSAGINVK